MKTFLLLAVVALAVTALPQEESLPGHNFLPAIPPATIEEVPETAFAEEAEFDTELDEVDEESFSDAQALVEKKGSTACSSLADATIKEVKTNIQSEQDILNKIDNGSKCDQEGQTAIDDATKALKSAEAKKKSADKALKDAKDAKVNFGDFKFSALNPNNCASMFGSSAYTSAKAKVDSAANAAAKASGEVTGAKGGVQAAKDAAVVAVKKCKCAAYQAHEKALAAANSKVASANKAAWTKGYHLKCVIAGTPSGSCTVPAMPKVKAVKLAAGVDSSACGGGAPTGLASFPLQTGHGSWGQVSTGSNKGVKITGNSQSGYNFVINNKNWNGWYRGAFGKWKINKSDLPVTLEFDWTSGGVTSQSNNAALTFMGFNYVANDKNNAWYDCPGDFYFRCRPNENMHEYTTQCNGKQGSCNCGTSGKLAIKISSAGKVTYYRNGQLCLTSAKTANQFPMYVSSSQYGGKATLSNIKLKSA